jgi:hypothetical protein
MKRKSSAATLGLIGGLALGVWIGAEVIDDRDRGTPPAAAAAVVEEPAAAPEPLTPKRVKRAVRMASSAPAAVDSPAAAAEAPKLVMKVPVSSPEFQASMKPVLARGTKVPVAVEGFADAEQFAALARASRNTQVPFILLKHRVLTEGMSLDARVEALKAKGEARGDILRLQMNAASN